MLTWGWSKKLTYKAWPKTQPYMWFILYCYIKIYFIPMILSLCLPPSLSNDTSSSYVNSDSTTYKSALNSCVLIHFNFCFLIWLIRFSFRSFRSILIETSHTHTYTHICSYEFWVVLKVNNYMTRTRTITQNWHP